MHVDFLDAFRCCQFSVTLQHFKKTDNIPLFPLMTLSPISSIAIFP